MTIEVLDPTYGDDTNEFALAGRPVSLEGSTVGVISNGKQGTRPFFDAHELELLERHGVTKGAVRRAVCTTLSPVSSLVSRRSRS